MGKIISLLVVGSTAATHMLFDLTGIPFLKEESVFHLPGVSIEVAKEYSGIRSSLGIFITAILAGHLFLEDRSEKGGFGAIRIPHYSPEERHTNCHAFFACSLC